MRAVMVNDRSAVDATASEPSARSVLGGVAGLLYVVVIVGQGAAASGVPQPTEDPATIASWLQDHATEAMVYAYLLALTAMLFVFFAVGVADSLRRAGAPRELTHAGALAASGSVSVLLLAAVALIVAVYINGTSSDAVVQALYVTNTVGGNVAAIGWAVLAGSLAVAAARARRRRWWVWTGAGGALGATGIALCTSRAGVLGGYSPVLMVGVGLWLVWVLAASIAMVRRPRPEASGA